jgi:hypothetical protein
MKLKRIACFVTVSLALLRNVSGQSFVNLNFENAIITPDPSSPYYPDAVYASDAIPGWTATGFIGPTDIYYDNLTLGAPCVAIDDSNGLYDSPPIDGAFSIILYGGGGPLTGASISQTGIVPASAESILFKAQYAVAMGGTLQVSLGGQTIPFSALSTGSNYTLYGGNVSAFAGQSEQLIFSASAGVNNIWTIDDIQFSPSPVPEPTEFALATLGILLLGFRRWRNSSRCKGVIKGSQ